MVSICADSSRSRVVQIHVVEHRDTSDVRCDTSDVHCDTSDVHCDTSDVHCDTSDVHCDTSDVHCDTSDVHCDTSDVHCRFSSQLGFVVIDISLAVSWANDQHIC